MLRTPLITAMFVMLMLPSMSYSEEAVPFTANQEEYQQALQAARTASLPAPADVDVPIIEKSFSADFVSLRRELIGDDKNPATGVSTPEQLDAVIERVSKPENFAKLSHQAQFVALQLRTLKPFKSFIYRARTYVGTNTTFRTMIVSGLRAQIAGISALSGNAAQNKKGGQWDVVFDYVTQPQTGMGVDIRSDQEMQKFLNSVLTNSVQVTNAFKKWVSLNQTVVWDNRLYMPFSNFASADDRYVTLGQPEQLSLLAASYLTLSGLYTATAYSLTGLHEAVKSTGQLFGVDTSSAGGFLKQYLGPNGADGMSSESRVGVLKQYPQLFVLVSDGQSRMVEAYKTLKSATEAARQAWELTKRLPAGQDNLFDPRAILPFNQRLGMSFDNVDALFAGKEVQSAVVNGDRVRVNLYAFYHNSPKSLSALYPVAFDKTPTTLVKKVDGRGVEYRNYRKGMAKAWSYSEYSKYFPDVKLNADGRTTSDIPSVARILTQTWGTAGFAAPLAGVIF